jgi:hypothetical protein
MTARAASIAESAAAIAVAALVLLWPAFWNGYPLVFSDTGTYLTQAIEHHLGWDRPPLYSLAILPLHMTLTTWPVVAAQALVTAHLLRLLCRALLPAARVWWLPALCAVLAVASAAPWFAAQLMPDIFTPLLAIALSLLALTPDRLGSGERLWLILLSAFMIGVHQANLPLALALLLLLAPLRRDRAAGGLRRLLAAPALACAALLAVNLAGHARLSLAPYGNVFVLARVIEDGPGLDALHRRCPHPGWRLCAWRDAMPANADDFLWRDDSPLLLAGGARLVSAEADGIIAAAVADEPGATARAALRNFARQATHFATGDGLDPWPRTVGAAIHRDFPLAEQTAYDRALQTGGRLAVPWPLPGLHLAAALLGIAGCAATIAQSRAQSRAQSPALSRRRDAAAGFAAAALLTVLVNAALTGCLSGPHDRYQSRVMWLPLAVALVALPASLAARRAPPVPAPGQAA